MYNEELAQEICNAIATHAQSVQSLCNENPHWPDRDTIFAWIVRYPDFNSLYARAKRSQAEVMVDELLDVADDKSGDMIVSPNGKITIDSEYINRSRLRIDTRKWIACKLIPKVYGDRGIIDEVKDNQDELRNELLSLREELALKNKKDY